MKCSVCGSDNLEGSAYCEDCGARLPMGVVAPPPAGEPTPAPTPAWSAPPPSPPEVAAQPVPQPAVPPPVPPPAAPLQVSPPAVPSPAAPLTPEAPAHVTAEQPAVPALAGTVTCAACGAENPAFESYCEDCGASLTTVHGAAVAPAPPLPVAPPPSVQVRPRLVVSGTGHEFLVDKDEVALGRRSPADGIFPEVDLTDVDTESYVSRRHGRISRQDGRFVYEDLGSSNGSFINDSRLQPNVQAEVRDGDRLRLGKTEMVFRVS